MTLYVRMFVGIFLFFSPSSWGKNISLRAHSLVKSHEVKLSDIFKGIPESNDHLVGDAPAPGKSYVLGIRNLRNLARHHQLDWAPQDPKAHVIIERASRQITSQEILPVLEEALRGSLSLEDVEIVLSSSRTTFHTPLEEESILEIKDLVLNPSQTHFRAKVVSGEAEMSLSGHLYPILEVPVLKEVKVKGQEIREEDLLFTKMSTKHIPKDAFMTKELLVGCSAKKTSLLPHVPLRKYDVEIVPAVTQGQLVTMAFKSDFMLLKTQGKAKETGHVGDVIRVVNLDSHFIVQGKITGKNQVDVLQVAPEKTGQKS